MNPERHLPDSQFSLSGCLVVVAGAGVVLTLPRGGRWPWRGEIVFDRQWDWMKGIAVDATYYEDRLDMLENDLRIGLIDVDEYAAEARLLVAEARLPNVEGR